MSSDREHAKDLSVDYAAATPDAPRRGGRSDRSDARVVVEASGIIRSATAAAARILGWSPRRSAGVNVFDYIHPDEARRALTGLALLARGWALPHPLELRVQHADGSWRRLEVKAEPASRHQRRPGAVTMGVRDITAIGGAGEQGGSKHDAAVLDSLHEIVFQTDPAGNWTYLNAAWTAVTGFDVAETIGRNFLDYVHPEEREHTIALFVAVVTGGADYCHHETRYRTASGGCRWLELRSRLRYDAKGHVVGNSGTIVDITQRRQAEQVLAEQTKVLELIAQDAPLPDTLAALAGLIARQTDTVVTVSTTPRRADVAWAKAAPAGGEEAVVAAIARPDGTVEATQSAPALRSLAMAPGPPPRLEVPIHARATGSRLGVFVLHHDSPVHLDEATRALQERCTYLAAIAIERRNAEDTARHQALHDPLTGLPNRTLMADRLEQALSNARRQRDSVALLLIDLDHFKAINDTLGHEAGDAVLREVATRLHLALRESDTICRLGGDEFAVVLPQLGDPAVAESVARKILAVVDEAFELEGLILRLRASVGIALHPGHGDDAAQLLRRADVAMYRAKQVGGGFAVYNPAHDQERLRRVGMAAELRRGIDSDELLLHYQPKIDLRTGRVVGVEGLVRWRHPLRGLIQPDDFISLAETTGLITSLTVWVLRTALSESRIWSGVRDDLRVAINLSADSLHDPRLPATIEEAVRTGSLPLGALELEITESAVMADPEGAVRVISALDASGIGVAIDDFGTGYSSLAYLKRLPAREIKIDKSFVRDMAADERDASIVRSAIELAHNLDIRVVAEGVETAGVSDLLRTQGCDTAQGFHYARPMPASDLRGWLRRRALA